MIQCCPTHFSASALYKPPRDTRSNYFVNKIFVISRLITKFTKILCQKNLELYGSRRLDSLWILHSSSSRQHISRSCKVNPTGPKLLFCLPFSYFCNRLPLCPCCHLLIWAALDLRVPPTTVTTDMAVLARIVFACSLVPVPACVGPEVSRLKKFSSPGSPHLTGWFLGWRTLRGVPCSPRHGQCTGIEAHLPGPSCTNLVE